MKITAQDLKQLKVIDEIIPEVKGGAHNNIKEQANLIDTVLKKSLDELAKLSKNELVQDRYQKFAKIGQYTVE